MSRACKYFFALSALLGSVALWLFTVGDYLITEPMEFTDTPPVLTVWGIVAVASGILAITMVVIASRLWLLERKRMSNTIGNGESTKSPDRT
jgi:hypothetical protein